MQSELITVIFAASLLLAPYASPAHHAEGHGDFAVEIVVSGLVDPTDFVFAPDGRIFVTELRGQVRVVKNGAVLPVPFIELDVNHRVERGLLGITVDPDFAQNGWVYLYYTPETNAGDPDGPKTNRLIRVQADGDVADEDTLQVVLGSVTGTPGMPSCDDFPPQSDCLPQNGLSHAGGALRFAADKTLFVSTGDGIWSGLSVADSLKALDLGSLAGKLLRILPNGRAPSDNPFFTGDPDANESKVWAYGFRNPYKFGIHPVTGIPYVGDVGSNFVEEVDEVAAATNQGWPCWEGGLQVSFYAGSDLCQFIFANPPSNLTFPLYPFARGNGAAVIGGVFAQGAAGYPVEFQGAYFFAEFVSGEVRTLRADPGVPFDPASVQTVASVAGPVDFELGPDAFVYYLSFLDGEIGRLVNTSVNVKPVARASAQPVAGLAPLLVEFSSEGTGDSNGDPVTLAWDFGDDTTSSDPDPSHLYSTDGTYEVTLTATDPDLAVGTDQLTIYVGKQPPQIEIQNPTDGSIYTAGEPLHFQAGAVDPEDGELTGPSVRWDVRLHHCVDSAEGADCHFHPFAEEPGNTLGLQAPSHGDPGTGDFFFLDATVTATDSDGISSSESIQVGPDIDADGCMDLYVSESVSTAPFLNMDDGGGFESGSGTMTAGRVSDPDGTAQLFVSSHAPPLGSAGGLAFARIFGDFTVTTARPHIVTLDADMNGSLWIDPAPFVANVGTRISGQIVKQSSAIPVADQTFVAHDFTKFESGPRFGQPVDEIGKRWNIVAELEPGSYWWTLETVAISITAADATSTIDATTALSTAVHAAQVCGQRIPSEALP